MHYPNWYELLDYELHSNGESWLDVVSNTMTEDEMLVRFDSGFGGPCGMPFTVWTHKRVYFPTEYDGSESVASVSRNPDGNPTQHI